MDVDVCGLTALELLDAYVQRIVSPVEVVDAVFERIDALNPSINAFLTLARDAAKDDAHRAEDALAANEGSNRPLLGIPVSIKDLTPTLGLRTTFGSLLSKDWVPDADSIVGERLRAAGAIILGKTNTSEFGWKGEAGNRLIGPTRNPWGLSRTSGGSSGGAAAAVASGMGPIAHGSDGAGSVRIPAAFCGVFGMKPSFGVVPYHPASPIGALAHTGALSRTVADARLLLSVMSGADPRDRFSIDQRIRAGSSSPEGLAGTKVAWSVDLGHASVETEVIEITSRAVAVFEELGCEVVETQPNFGDPYDALDSIWAAAHAGSHRDNLEEVRELVDPGRLAVIERGRSLSAQDVGRAHIDLSRFAADVLAFMEPFDLLVTPTLPLAAFEAGADQPGSVAGRETEYLSWTPFTYPFNITGQPAATVPCGLDSRGLPVGLQIVGRWRDDEAVLRAATAFEGVRPWPRLAPLSPARSQRALPS